MSIYSQQPIFMRLPKFLFTHGQYQRLSPGAKLAYALLSDRRQLSVKGNWRTENFEIFLIYPNQELAAKLGVSEHTAIKYKRELERCHLLKQERRGLNQPNRLILLKPALHPQDVYCPVAKNKAIKVKATKSQPSQTEPQSAKLDFSKQHYQPRQIAQQNQTLLHSAHKFMLQGGQQASFILNEEGTRLLGQWCQTPAQLHHLVGIILGAKKRVQVQLQALGQADLLDFDDPYQATGSNQELQIGLTMTLHKFFNAVRRAEDDPGARPIANQEAYLAQAMVNFFDRYANEKLLERRRDQERAAALSQLN